LWEQRCTATEPLRIAVGVNRAPLRFRGVFNVFFVFVTDHLTGCSNLPEKKFFAGLARPCRELLLSIRHPHLPALPPAHSDMTGRTPGWIVGTRVVPALFAGGLLCLTYNAIVHPVPAEELAALAERRDPGGRRKARAIALRDAYNNEQEQKKASASPVAVAAARAATRSLPLVTSDSIAPPT
jgi:hypothetical protein